MIYNILREDTMNILVSEGGDLINDLGLYKYSSKDDLISARYVRGDDARTKLFKLASMLSVGLLPLACIYQPVLKTKLTKIDCEPSVCDTVIVTIDNKEISAPSEICSIHNKTYVFVELGCKRYFSCSEHQFKLIPLNDAPNDFFEKFIIRRGNSSFSDLYKMFYGLNVMRLPAANVWDILLVQLLAPFFVFQYFAFIVWMIEEYWAFAVIILVITFVSIYLNTMEQLFNLRRLHELAGKSDKLDCLDDITGAYHLEPDSELIPGRRFRVAKGMRLPCDCVLISGRVVVDESMLTGECVPVTKVFFEFMLRDQ